MSLKGQATLVTGGASGIGLAMAKKLLQEGANVMVCDVSAAGAAVVQELQKEFGAQRCLFAHVDVRDETNLDAAFTATKTTFKRLDIVINSAGVLNDLDWSLEVDINLKGVMRGTMLAWKHMGKHEGGNGGAVVNIASIAGLMGIHVMPGYSATKHAVVGFGRSIGDEYHLKRTGVRVLTICPGFTDTAILTNNALLFEDLEEELPKLMEIFPMQQVDNVTSGILHMIQHGDSGSVWVSEGEQPVYELQFPLYPDLRVAK